MPYTPKDGTGGTGGGGIPNPDAGVLADNEMVKANAGGTAIIGTGDTNTALEVNFGSKDIKCKSVITESASVEVGPGVSLSDRGGFVQNTSNITGRDFVMMDYRIDDTGTQKPIYYERAAKVIRDIVQPDDGTTMLNISSYTVIPTKDQDILRVYIKLVNPITNFRGEVISDVTGEVVKYIPSRNDFDNGTGLTFAAGEQFFEFDSPLAEDVGFPLTVNVFADQPIDVLGNGTNPWRAVDSQDITSLEMLDITDYAQRQTIRSGVKGNFFAFASNNETEIQIVATDPDGCEIFFKNDLDVDDRDGFSILMQSQFFNVATGPLDTTEIYHVSVDDSGEAVASLTKTSFDDQARVHLLSFTAINGQAIPESIVTNPYLTYSDKTLQGILETEGIQTSGFNVESADAGDLSLQRDAYNLISNGGNYINSRTNVHSRRFLAETPMLWTYLWSSVTAPPTVGTESQLDPTQWDNAGTLELIGGAPERSTVQTMVITRSGQEVILYGQFVYDKYEDAVQAALNGTADPTFPAGLIDAKIVAQFAMRQDATLSADSNQVSIIITPQAGGGSGQLPETTTFLDADFTLEHSLDTSSKVKFDLSSVPTGTINTYGFPEAAGTLALDRPVVNITSGTSVTIDAPKYNQDSVYYISSPNNFTVFFSDEAAKANARVTIVKAMDRRLTFQSLGATRINGAVAGTQFDQFKEYQVFEFIQSDFVTGKTWTFDPGDREQSIAYVKFNPQGLAVGQEVNYRNAGKGFRVFKVGTGQFQVENDGTILNDLRQTWSSQGASGARGVFEIDCFIFGIAGHTVNVYTWSSGNGPNTGQPGTVNVEVTNANGVPTDVTNANGHIYFEYKETI